MWALGNREWQINDEDYITFLDVALLCSCRRFLSIVFATINADNVQLVRSTEPNGVRSTEYGAQHKKTVSLWNKDKSHYSTITVQTSERDNKFGHFFFLFCRFGPETLTLPGIIRDISVSCRKEEQKWIYNLLQNILWLFETTSIWLSSTSIRHLKKKEKKRTIIVIVRQIVTPSNKLIRHTLKAESHMST